MVIIDGCGDGEYPEDVREYVRFHHEYAGGNGHQRPMAHDYGYDAALHGHGHAREPGARECVYAGAARVKGE